MSRGGERMRWRGERSGRRGAPERAVASILRFVRGRTAGDALTRSQPESFRWDHCTHVTAACSASSAWPPSDAARRIRIAGRLDHAAQFIRAS
jgi:hypothetical protein